MASFFRTAGASSASGAGGRRPPVPAALTGGSSAVHLGLGTDAATKQARRVSRTDEDFERALMTSETRVLHEGMDESALGGRELGMSSSTPRRTSSRTPATPTVLPPTPQQNQRQHPHPYETAPPFDLDDVDLQTKRRSLLRSPGTASSPDLATLVRRTKEAKSSAQNHSPADADGRIASSGVGLGFGAGSWQRTPSSVSSNYSLVTPPSPPSKDRDAASDFPQTPSTSYTSYDRSAPSTPDWQNSSPRPRTLSKEGYKSVKATMKSKTSNFLGKMWGQGSVRDKPRSNTVSGAGAPPPSSYVAPPLPASFSVPSGRNNIPPVPPLPTHYRSPSRGTSAGSSSVDIFQSAENSPVFHDKPLPAVQPQSSSGHTDEGDTTPDSVAPRTRSPDVIKPTSEREGRRRSASMNGVDWRQAVADGPGGSSKSTSNEWERTMRSFVGDFTFADVDTGKLGSPDDDDSGQPTIKGRGNLRTSYRKDASPTPSLPSVVLTESISLDAGPNTASSANHSGGFPDSPGSSAVHLVCDSPASESTTLSTRPSVTRMTSRPRMPQRSSLTSVQSSSSARSTQTHAPRPVSALLSLGVSASSPDASRLRIQHRSVASTSEPSLIHPQAASRISPPATPQRMQSGGARSLRLVSAPPISGDRSPQNRGSQSSDHEDLDVKGNELATRCWNEDETFLAREKIAEFLGGMSALSSKALQHYMKFYDFTGLRLDHAFRRLCAKLYLRAETQQVDRILVAFGEQYFENNPQCLFGSTGIVHSVSYSLLLLNTDLHIAEISTRMSRGQFVRNTMQVVMPQRRQLLAEMDAPSTTVLDTPTTEEVASPRPMDTSEGTSTMRMKSKRSGSIQSWKSISRDMLPGADSASSLAPQQNDRTTAENTQPSSTSQSLVPSMNSSTHRNWELEMESLLKEMYNSVKSNQILQPVVNGASPHNTLLRNRSQRGQQDRLNTFKRGSIRGIHALLGAQDGPSPYSSHSSLDGRSPSPSSSTSMTDQALSTSNSSYFAPTIGFASNLSRTIIREAQEDDHASVASGDSDESNVSITDEELALHGPPWAKEGMVSRKLYWESTGKRARNKNWSDVFAVISKGELKMFTFGESGGMGANVVGGGNWLTSASSAGDAPLAHSLAHVLPPPGYNRQRPHCFVLTLASGAVFFFQAGTEDLVNEWVATCNYWAARQSKEPLAGGVSNMEYGWNRVSDTGRYSTSASTEDFHDAPDPSETFSVRSGRSKMSKRSFVDAAATMRGRQSPRDRIYINDWKAPIPSTVASTHDEETQLEAMQKQLAIVRTECEAHEALHDGMVGLYAHRSSNLSKAQANWDRKSVYLKSEAVKYLSYVEALRSAMAMRLKKRGEKALERALSGTVAEDHTGLSDENYDDPKTPVSATHNRHRREVAEDDADE